MSEIVHAGGCFCGAVRYEARGPAENCCLCHCTSCRRAAGATPVAWGTFALERFAITRGELALYRSSPPVTRGFCAACGTSLTYAHAERAGEIDVTLATLDVPERLRPERHLWIEDRIDWAPLTDGLPQHRTWRAAG
jgi:hypothetical protein